MTVVLKCSLGLYPPVTTVALVWLLTRTTNDAGLLYSTDFNDPVINGVVRAFAPTPDESTVPWTSETPMLFKASALSSTIPNFPLPSALAMNTAP